MSRVPRSAPAAHPDAVEVLVIGSGPQPGADAAAVAREIAARLPEGRPGRVVLALHSPDGDTDGPFPIPAHRAGAILLDWAARGLTWDQTRADLDAVRDRLVDVDGTVALRRVGVAVLAGRVSFLGRGQVAVEVGATGDTTLLNPGRVVLATGAAAAVPDVAGILETRFLTSSTVLDLPELPGSVVVLGAGSLGCELAQGFARLGSTVTLVETRPRVLPDDDAAAAQALDRALREDGVRMILGASVAKVAPTLDGGAWVGTDTGGDVAAEAFVVAGGRRARVAGLDLGAAGVELTATGAVRVDDRLRTTNPDVLALGDVTGLPAYGAAPGPMARLAAANTVARRPALRWSQPTAARVTRTAPEVVQVGPVSPGLRDAAPESLPDGVLDDGSTVGMCPGPVPGSTVTIIVGSVGGRGVLGLGGPSGRTILSATLVGAGASEAAGQLVLAAAAGLPAAALIDTAATDGSWAAAVQVAVARALAG